MRIRIRFSKLEPLQYLGHLDVMRFFQKAIRRAHLPVRYSDGFSPHMLLSFASPLGVGKVSEAEYFDLDLQEEMAIPELLQALQAQMVSGIDVLDAARIEEGKKTNGMRVIAAASYRITLPDAFSVKLREKADAFYRQASIRIIKKTKKKEEETEIRPWIYRFAFLENDLLLLLSAGSTRNIKPEWVLAAFAAYCQETVPATGIRICRTELYANRGTDEAPSFVSLLDCDRRMEEGVCKMN